VTITADGKSESRSFVTNLPVSGAPTDRLERLLASLLSDKYQVMRLIWLLLQNEGETSAASLSMLSALESSANSQPAAEVYPIFESLVRSAADGPHRLRDVGRLIEDLQRTSEGRALIPEGLPELWKVLQEVTGHGRQQN